MTEIDTLLAQYIADSDELYRKKTGIRTALAASLGGTNEIKKDPMHQKFYDDLKQAVETLAQTGDQEACTQALEVLLQDKQKGHDLVQYGWLMAAETLSIPLVKLVPDEVLRPLWESYGKRYPKRERLPKQEELYRTMAKKLGIPRLKWK